MPRYISLPQVAELYAVTPRTIRRWVSDGRLPAYRVGSRALRFRAEDVDALARRIPTGGAR